MRLSLILIALLSLSACRGIWEPGPFASGYAFHQEQYKAPPGPMAQEIGYDYSAGKNEETLTLWRDVARQSIDALEIETGQSAQPVFVETLPAVNAFNTSFDHALREELRTRGYTLQTFEGDHLHLQYEAFFKKDENVRKGIAYNGDPEITQRPYNRDLRSGFVVAINALRSGKPVGQVANVYNLTGYGYVSGEGRTDVSEMVKESR